jgi:nickel/cobalt exporter
MLAKRLGLFLTLLVVLCLSRTAMAHPMGNFSVNHYSRIDLKGDRIQIEYFIDLAEIPAYQELQQGSITATAGDAGVTRYVSTRGVELGHGLSLTLDGRLLPLRMISSGVIFPPGAGGLPTMKMGFVYEAAYPSDALGANASLHFADNNYPGHSGWKEIIAVASAGSLLKSSVSSIDRSEELSNYPTDLLNSPPQNLEASLEFSVPALPVENPPAKSQPAMEAASRTAVVRSEFVKFPISHSQAATTTKIERHRKESALAPPIPGRVEFALARSPSVALKANQQQTPRSKFTELITAQHLSPWFLFTAAFIAIGLGGLHALEPGHGKTIVAAYLVGSRGTARHAILLGMIVTVSHTAGVFALGAITLYASHYIVPEQLYPWLGVLSGITIAGLGCYMFLRRWTGTATEHSHAEAGAHSHSFFGRRSQVAEDGGNLQPAVAGPSSNAKPVSLAQLFTLGITGGIIPCPAALIVLLSAFALHRIGLGFFLIVAFSIGLAVVLIGFGMLMVYAGRFMTRFKMDGPLTKRWLPLASSAFITVLGLGLVIQALKTTHLILPQFPREQMGTLLFVIGLGLVLGMRHSTDADHVVAISTIVSKQRSIRNAAFIGSIWGLGHTITIFIVGSLIILFGVEIPPRVGLSMEFCVALMLILLGILNLTGVMQKITAYLTPASFARANAACVEQGSGKATEKWLSNPVGRFGLYQCIRPLAIGLVHGLAGSAAVALLVLSTIHDPVWATVYLLIFGLGTMIGMMFMTAAMAVPLTYAGDRFNKLGHYLGLASGMVSLCFGSFLVYQLGFLGGLFTSHPQWTPR